MIFFWGLRRIKYQEPYKQAFIPLSPIFDCSIIPLYCPYRRTALAWYLIKPLFCA